MSNEKNTPPATGLPRKESGVVAVARSTSRSEQAAGTRARIFEAALALFEKRGYDNVTVDDICDRVGMSKGAFYTHFKAKDQILLEEFSKIDGYYQELSDEVAGLEDGVERLRAFWMSSLEHIERMGVGVVRIVFLAEIGPSRRTSFIASKKRPVFRIIENLVRDGQSGGYLRTDMAPDEIAGSAVSCWRGLVYEWCLANGRFDLPAAGDRVFDLLADGLVR